MKTDKMRAAEILARKKLFKFVNWNDLQRRGSSPVQKLLLRCSLWRVKKKLRMDMYNRACWVRAYCYFRQKLVSTGILYISDIFTFLPIFSNISKLLQYTPTPSNILQYPPISSNILQYPPISSNILQYPPISSNIL